MLDFDILSWAAGGVVLILILPLVWWRKRSWPFMVCFSIFWVYLMIVVKVTLFPIPIDDYMVETLRQTMGLGSAFNMVPGRLSSGGYVNVSQMFFNLLLGVPFGFGLNFLTRIRWRWSALVVLGFGLVLEAAQLVVSLVLGFPYRVFDINDLLMSALGAISGYAVFRGFARVYANVDSKDPGERGRLRAFLQAVTIGRGEARAGVSGID